ncbi:MAG: hypothetical protein DWQ05_11330 [Calditrichaeota bacterium]|nr:MAG: hypothetical protein DWQ05_11330 [Calditrichota bacterium]
MQVQWILRIGVFGTFLGHGIFAFSVKPAWVVFLTTVGFSGEMAVKLMPVIGVIDIIIAVLALVKPMRVVLIYAFIWALATAIMRPVVGLPIWDFVERSSNWAVPLALLFLAGLPRKFSDLFKIE